MFHSLDISTSALVAQRHRMDTISANIANLNTTRNEKGELSPFQRRLVQFQAAPVGKEAGSGSQGSGESSQGLGVKYTVEVDQHSEPRKVYNPGHPDADPQGNVHFPNINLVHEFVNAVEASRAYEANVTAIEMTKTMLSQTLRILA